MKQISIRIRIGDEKRIETITLEKHGPDNEIETLAGAMSSIFLKSKEAAALTEKRKKARKK